MTNVGELFPSNIPSMHSMSLIAKHPVGILNVGNSCFMNACLQILLQTNLWNAFLESPNFEEKLNPRPESVLLMEWKRFSKSCCMASQNNKSPINPTPFVEILKKVAHYKNQELFCGNMQNDLSEFLLFLMDCFHSALQREVNMEINGSPENQIDEMALLCFKMIQSRNKKEYSEVLDIFYGMHISQITKWCDSSLAPTVLSQTAEPFFMMDLSLPPNTSQPSLEDCLQHYLQGEVLDDLWRNEKTNTMEKVQKQIRIWNFAPIVVFALKRFDPISHQKNDIPVSFPLNSLDLSPYVVGYNKNQYMYECFGICNHYGNHLDGHYTAFVRGESQTWFHCNDHLIQEVMHPERMVTPFAYCLFYKRVAVRK